MITAIVKLGEVFIAIAALALLVSGLLVVSAFSCFSGSKKPGAYFEVFDWRTDNE